MSLPDFANLWRQLIDYNDHRDLPLVPREDLSFIVQECLGRLWHNVYVNTGEGDSRTIPDAILLKRLFDLQRTKLRSDVSGKVVPPNVLLEALECIATLATNVAKRTGHISRTTKQSAALRILRAAFVSGFRLALLYPRSTWLMREDPSRLQKLVGQWPNGEEMDKTWTLPLLEHTLYGLQDPTLRPPPCEKHGSPEAPVHSFMLTYDPSRCVKAAAACIGNDCEHWLLRVWILLDARLTILVPSVEHLLYEEATLSSINTSPHQGGFVAPSDDEPRIHRQWLALVACLRDKERKVKHSERLKSLVDFLEEIEPEPEYSKDFSRQVAWESPKLSVQPNAQPLSYFYKNVTDSLRKRNRAVIRSNSGLAYRMVDELTDSINAWIPPSSINLSPGEAIQGRTTSSVEIKSTTNLVYILNCPQLHPISYDSLLSSIEDTPHKHGKKELESYAEHFEVRFECPFHDSPPPVVDAARMLVPLAQVLQKMTDSSAGPVVQQSDNESDSGLEPPSDSLESPDTEYTPKTPTDKTQSSPFTPPPPRRSFGGIFNTHKSDASHQGSSSSGSSRNNKEPRRRKHLWAALSPDATNLAVWSTAKISCFSIAEKKWTVTHSGDEIGLAAVGSSHFAIASPDANAPGDVLSLYEIKTGKAIGTKKAHLGESTWNIAFSFNGSRVAVSGFSCLRVFLTKDQNWASDKHFWNIPLRQDQLVPSIAESKLDKGKRKSAAQQSASGKSSWVEENMRIQTLSFSPDGEGIVLAASFDHCNTGNTSLIGINLSRDGRSGRLTKNIKYDSGRGLGLTAVPCFRDDDLIHYLICAITSDGEIPKVEAIRTKPDDKKNLTPSNITNHGLQLNSMHAAISVQKQGGEFILANRNMVVRLSRSRQGFDAQQLQLKMDKQGGDNKDRGERVKIAAASSSNIVVFYFLHGNGRLISYDARSDPQTREDTISMEEFD